MVKRVLQVRPDIPERLETRVKPAPPVKLDNLEIVLRVQLDLRVTPDLRVKLGLRDRLV